MYIKHIVQNLKLNQNLFKLAAEEMKIKIKCKLCPALEHMSNMNACCEWWGVRKMIL